MTHQDPTEVCLPVDPTAPLAGIRVLEFGGYIAGPYAGTFLANLGAEVIKVEPESGEPFRHGRGNGSKYFAQINFGKKSVAVDAKTAEGHAAILELVRTADVIIENLRPGKMDALGLGADVCRAIRPELVFASISGFGAEGEYANRPAYDSIGQSMAGMYTIMSEPGQPELTGTCLADLTSGITLAMGIMAALVRRFNGTGDGVHVETSMLEAMTALTIDAVALYDDTGVAPTRESRNSQAVNFCLPTASGEFITVHLSSAPKFFEGFARVLERPDLIADTRFDTFQKRSANFLELKEIVREELRKRPLAEWLELLAEADVPHAPVLDVPGAIAHPQTRALGVFSTKENGDTVVEVPWRFNARRRPRSHHAPHVGEQNEELLGSAATMPTGV